MKHFYYCTILLWSCLAFGQQQSTDSLYDDLQIQTIRPYVKAEYGFGALCNSPSTSELLNFATSDFLQKEDKDQLMNSINGTLRYGYFSEFSITYRQPGYYILDFYKKGQGFSITNKYYNSARLSQDLLKLIFYGNKPYAGDTLNLAKSKYETWYYTTLDYHFDLKPDSLPAISFTAGLNIGHDYSFYDVKKADLYTDPEGAFLDMNLDYRLRDRTLDAQPIAGLGLAVGASTSFLLSEKSQLHLELKDLGVLYFTGGRSLDVDSTFRFQGVEFSNIFDLNDSLTKAAEDEYRETFYYNEEGGYARLTPFRIAATYFHQLSKGRLTGISVSADYLYLAGYYPRLAVGAHLKTGYKQKLLAQLSTGGYNLASLDLAYEIKFARYWKFNLSITNFSALVVPVISGGAYGMVGLSYDL